MAPLSDQVAAKVRRQVEFYFSDSNLPNDKYLLKTINESADGLVSLPVVCAFSRMKGHLGLDTKLAPEEIPEEVVTAVGEALKSCSTLKVSEDGLKVGRTAPISGPEELRELVKARTRAVSPLSWKESRENVERFFGGIAKVLSVRMPRHPNSQSCFIGSALVEFDSVEEAERVSQMPLTFNGVALEFQSKEKFDEYMNSLRAARIKGMKFAKGLIVKFTLETRKATDETKADEKNEDGDEQKDEMKDEQKDEMKDEQKDEMKDEQKDEMKDEQKDEMKDEQKDEMKDEQKDEMKDEQKDEMKDEQDDEQKEDANVVLREDVKAVVEQYGSVRFIDFMKGGQFGYIRFDSPEGAEKARTAAVIAEEGGLVVKNQIALLEALEGEAEVAYWDAIYDGQNRKKEQFAHSAYRGRRGRGRRGFDRSSKEKNAGGKHLRLDAEGGEDGGEPEKKIQKTE